MSDAGHDDADDELDFAALFPLCHCGDDNCEYPASPGTKFGAARLPAPSTT